MKKVISIILASVMVLSLVACGSKQTATEEPATQAATQAAKAETQAAAEEAAEEAPAAESSDWNPADHMLVFSSPLINHPTLRTVELGFADACKDLGYQYQIVGPEACDYGEMCSMAEAAVASGADGLMLWVGEETSVAAVANIYNDFGTVISCPHQQWKEGTVPGLSSNLSADPVVMMEGVADFVAERLEGKTGSLAVTGASYTPTETLEFETLKKCIEEYQAQGKLQGIKVLDYVVEGGEDITDSTNVNAGIIQANSDIVGAVSITGAGAVTWSNAARKCGKEAGELMIIGFDFSSDNIAELESGYCTALVAQPLYTESYEGVKVMDKALRGEPFEYYTLLEAPMVYLGGTGDSDPELYKKINERVNAGGF